MGKIITADFLLGTLSACSGVDEFAEKYPDGFEVTVENIKAAYGWLMYDGYGSWFVSAINAYDDYFEDEVVALFCECNDCDYLRKSMPEEKLDRLYAYTVECINQALDRYDLGEVQ